MPLAVVLPSTTEEVAAVLRSATPRACRWWPRGAGTSLCGGAIPQEDAVVLGVAKMNRVLDVNFADRTMRVEAGITNLAISGEVGPCRLLLRARSLEPARLHHRAATSP
jgi:glycolate oxidase